MLTKTVRRIAGLWLAPAALIAAGLAVASGADQPAEPRASAVDSAAVARFIDERIDGPPAPGRPAPPLADDAEFLRRVSLDLVGVIPSAEKVAAFLKDADPKKRARVIDDLLTDPRYGFHQADRWESLLMIRDSTNKRLKGEPLYRWLADRFHRNQPWDRLVSDLLTATGTQEENGASTFFIALRTPEKLTDQTTRLFLGVQLQCAQCHDHPFDRWKRADYWSMAAFFSKVRAGGRKVGLAKYGVESVNEEGLGKKAPPVESEQILPPRFLGGDRPSLASGKPYRPALAAWMTAGDNPFFARAMVNRTWSDFFGRGLINPVDNLSPSSPASHPELLDGLASRFAAGGFDLKALIRGICNSRAYQAPSRPAADSGEGPASYERMVVRPMTPEQLFDSLSTVLGTMNPSREAAKGKKRGQPTANRAGFVAFFDAPDGAEPTDYTVGIPQVLQLMNSPQLNGEASLVGKLTKAGLPAAEAVERLYLTTLSRMPTAAEVAILTGFLAKPERTPREALEDVLWVLLNSSEFALNH